MRGRKPKPTQLKLIMGTLRKGRASLAEPMPAGRPARPKACRGKARAIWDRTIEPAWWLSYFDGPKAFMLCELAAEFESDPARMNAARIGQLRGVCSDLGFDSAAQRKLGVSV